MSKRATINDEDRRQWIESDEGLYNMQRSSRQPMRFFIRTHRAEIDAVINNVRTGAKPAHYLEYHHGPGCACYGCTRRSASR